MEITDRLARGTGAFLRTAIRIFPGTIVMDPKYQLGSFKKPACHLETGKLMSTCSPARIGILSLPDWRSSWYDWFSAFSIGRER
jgi:hypothetical protein